jgi:hypothetical protein
VVAAHGRGAARFLLSLRVRPACVQWSPMKRRRFLGSMVALAAAPVGAVTVADIGHTRQLFLDDLLVERMEGLSRRLNPAYQPEENLIAQDKPWETVRATLYNSVLEYGGAYHMWYCAYGGATPDSEEIGPRLECYAVSTDGIRWEKPALGLVEFQGSKANNIVRVYSIGQVFVDPFDDARRRFKSIQYQAPRPYAGWAPGAEVKGNAIYLAYSPDGRHWDLEREPVLPFYSGAPSSTVWDERLGKWVVYVRVNPPGHATDPWKSHLAYGRVEVGRDALARPYPFTADPAKKRNQFGSFGGPTNEFPVVLEADQADPDHQVYTMNAVRYPGTDFYLAFPGFWYPNTSDKDDVQFAFSRDGIHWQRPLREPVIRLGRPGSGTQGYVCAAEGFVRRGDEIWLYYGGLPERHLSPNVNWESVTARAIFRLDGFVSLDADQRGGRFLTRPFRFQGHFLELNVDTSAGGVARVAMQDAGGRAIPGYSLEECHPMNGNSVRMRASWLGRTDVGQLEGSVVRLAVTLRGARLYAFQFV